MKKKICFLSLLAVILLLFTGCHMAEEAQDDRVVITVWTDNYHDKTFVEKKVGEWNATVGKEKNIRIDYQVKNDLQEILTDALAVGKAPDMFPIFGDDLEYYVRKFWVKDLDGMPGGEALISRFKGKLSYNKHMYGGKTYTLPNSTTTYGLVYNKDMFVKAGLVDENGEAKPPQTLAELREHAKTLTNAKHGRYGIIFPAKDSEFFNDVIMKPATGSTRCYGYDPVNGRYNYSSLVDMMNVIMEIKADGSCVPGAEFLDNDSARARFAEGGIGMFFSASYDYNVFANQFPVKDEWGVAPYPVADTAHARKQYSESNRYLAINNLSIYRKGADNLMEVYRWFYSDEMMADAYVEGINLPVNMAKVKDIVLDKNMKQWQEYANLQEVSAITPMQMPYDIPGKRTPEEIWMEDIWSGKVPLEEIPEVCKQISDMLNEGVELYQLFHPAFHPEDLILPEWEGTSLRRSFREAVR